jgi:hypothetical protein
MSNENTTQAGEKSPADNTPEFPGMESTKPAPPVDTRPAAKVSPPKRKRGRPRKNTGAPGFADIERAAKTPLPGEAIPPAANPDPAAALPDSPEHAEPLTVENITCETIIGILQICLVFVGEEEGVLSKTEKTLLRPGLERLLRKYEIGETALPAELEVLLAVAGIVIERIKKGGKTATAFAKFRAFCANLWSRHKGAQVGAQMRREVPVDLVSKLQDKVARLEGELSRKAEQPTAKPAGDIPDPGAPVTS